MPAGALNGSDCALPTQVAQDVIQAMLECASKTPFGPFVEVGVFQGGTAWHLARLAQHLDREVWLYDTFVGTPYSGPHDSHKVGDFSECSADAIRAAIPYAHIVGGIFPGSAAHWLARPAHPIAFVHLDCDQERSYRESIAFLKPLMAVGGVMWFDDAPCLPGARLAVLEVFPHPNEDHGKWWVRL
jgi:macrocin-O-methyltransferase TylF-like protien